ncbi:hypothetical protein MKQ68_08465 [Chitinophaga horti]|uniref:Stress-induced acidophilic repeat motif-containing protein n=1 Tax=Chitinophaga horti TaxID=2920382 RepID=A0ABY6J680_9BACT|nr:hypothetical protein [Chitinophaga horti]UYQ95128.1 hypothetical protein MKQ68_08465 [Chitinophaga horti]
MATKSNDINRKATVANSRPQTVDRGNRRVQEDGQARQHIDTDARKNRYEDQEDYDGYDETNVGRHAEDDRQGENFDDTFVSGYDEDYEEDEDLDAATMHQRREAIKSAGGRSRANKVTDRHEHSVTGERNREQGYKQRAGAATPKARKGSTEKK